MFFGVPGVLVLVVVVLGSVLQAREQAESRERDAAAYLPAGVKDPQKYGVEFPAGPVRSIPRDPAGYRPGRTPLLDAVEPRSLYFAMLKRQSTRQVTDHVSQLYQSQRDYRVNYPANPVTERIGIDYRKRAQRVFIREIADTDRTGRIDSMDLFTRCADHRTATYHDDPSLGHVGWEVDPPAPDDSCANRLVPGRVVDNSTTSDGIAAGGLTDRQADQFLSYLDGVRNLFTVQRPKLVTGSDGRVYLQLDVRQNQLDEHDGSDIAAGAAFLEAGFAQTGQAPEDYPYSMDIGPGEGRQIRYFVDPATLLPAYAVMRTLPSLRLDGSPAEGAGPRSYTVFAYSFPEQLDPAARQAVGAPRDFTRPLPFPQVFLGGR